MPAECSLDHWWANSIREYAQTPVNLPSGESYRPIGNKSLKLLNALWRVPRRTPPDIGSIIEGGGKVLFWSDPHFGHVDMVRRRGEDRFRDVGAMDREIWENLAGAAPGADAVVCLGDYSLQDPIEAFEHCRTVLGERHVGLVGNHDARSASRPAWVKAGAWASLAFSLPTSLILSWAESEEGKGVEMSERLPQRISFGISHWPLPPHALPGPDWVNLHGHIHARVSAPPGINCCVEATDYRPVELRDLIRPDLLRYMAAPKTQNITDQLI